LNRRGRKGRRGKTTSSISDNPLPSAKSAINLLLLYVLYWDARRLNIHRWDARRLNIQPADMIVLLIIAFTIAFASRRVYAKA
jgi:hypothetical protein